MSVAGNCGDLASTGAFNIVEDSVQLMQTYADETLQVALNTLGDLQAFTVAPVNFATGFDPGGGQFTPFQKPPPPVDPDPNFDVREPIPTNPVLQPPPSKLSVGRVPTFTVTAPVISIPDPPAPLDVAPPADQPPLTVITLPADPDGTLPEVPTQALLTLPTIGLGLSPQFLASVPQFAAPNPTLQATPPAPFAGTPPEFTATEPEFTATAPDRLQPITIDPGDSITIPSAPVRPVIDSNVNIPNHYVADLASYQASIFTGSTPPLNQELIDRIGEMLAGGTGLPADIQSAIFDVSAAAEDRSLRQLLQTAHEEWGARGFELRGGRLDERIVNARQTNQSAKLARARDIRIHVANMEIENLRFSVQQTIVFADQYRRHYATLYTLAESIASRIFEIGRSVYLARIELMRLQVALYQADAAVFETLVRAELANLEVFRLKIEVARINVAIQQSNIGLYGTEATVFNSQVNVFQAKIAEFTAQVGLYNTDADVYARIQLGTYQVEIDAFRAQVTKFGADVTKFGADTGLYSAQGGIYQTELVAAINEHNAKVGAQDLINGINNNTINLYRHRLGTVSKNVEVFRAQVDGINTLLASDANELELFKQRIGAYSAQVEAKNLDFEGYASLVRGKEAEANTFESQARAFASEVQAWGQEVNAEVSIEELKLRFDDIKIRQFQAQIAAYQAALQTEAARVDAAVNIYNGQTRIYSSDIGAEQARAVSDTRAHELNIEIGRTQGQLNIAAAGLNIEQVQREAQLILQSLISIAQVSAGLAQASLTAVNVGATVGNTYGANESVGCRTTLSGSA